MAKKPDPIVVDTWRIMTIRVNKDRPEEVKMDFGEFAEWEVRALLAYAMEALDWDDVFDEDEDDNGTD